MNPSFPCEKDVPLHLNVPDRVSVTPAKPLVGNARAASTTMAKQPRWRISRGQIRAYLHHSQRLGVGKLYGKYPKILSPILPPRIAGRETTPDLCVILRLQILAAFMRSPR
jgi:hypothetical protein